MGAGGGAVRSGATRTSGDDMTWWMKILAIWAPFVVIALLVIAVAAANAWIERRSERERWYEAIGETGKHSTQALRDRLAEVPAAPRHDQPLALAQPPPHTAHRPARL